MANFVHARKTLIVWGVIICCVGVAFEVFATSILSGIYATIPKQDEIGAYIISFITSLIRFCIAPMGASMIAIGIALGLVRQDQTVEQGRL